MKWIFCLLFSFRFKKRNKKCKLNIVELLSGRLFVVCHDVTPTRTLRIFQPYMTYSRHIVPSMFLLSSFTKFFALFFISNSLYIQLDNSQKNNKQETLQENSTIDQWFVGRIKLENLFQRPSSYKGRRGMSSMKVFAFCESSSWWVLIGTTMKA